MSYFSCMALTLCGSVQNYWVVIILVCQDDAFGCRCYIKPLEAAMSLPPATGSSGAVEVEGAGCSGELICILWHTSNACPTVRTILIA